MLLRLRCPVCQTPFLIKSEEVLSADEARLLAEEYEIPRNPEWEP